MAFSPELEAQIARTRALGNRMVADINKIRAFTSGDLLKDIDVTIIEDDRCLGEKIIDQQNVIRDAQRKYYELTGEYFILKE